MGKPIRIKIETEQIDVELAYNSGVFTQIKKAFPLKRPFFLPTESPALLNEIEFYEVEKLFTLGLLKLDKKGGICISPQLYVLVNSNETPIEGAIKMVRAGGFNVQEFYNSKHMELFAEFYTGTFKEVMEILNFFPTIRSEGAIETNAPVMSIAEKHTHVLAALYTEFDSYRGSIKLVN